MKRLLLIPYRYFRFMQYFTANYKPIGISNIFWCLFNGFFPKNFILFKLATSNSSEFVTDYEENFRVCRINKNTEILNNKLLFPEVIGGYFKTPETRALIYAGKFLPYHTTSCFGEQAAILHLKTRGPLILKPFDGDGGIGIVKVSCINEEIFQWNGVEITEDKLLKNFSTLNGYMVSDFVNQASYSNTIFSGSVNTIRLLTMVDPQTGEPFIGAAAHRIGNSGSAPVDNCAMGGYTAAIDLETGKLSAATATKFKSSTPPYYATHPDSGAPIEGVVIPNWKELEKEVLSLHSKLRFISYIGWDIVAGEDGKFYILEGNDGADLKLHQAHAPLLQNPAVKAFYKYHKAIK